MRVLRMCAGLVLASSCLLSSQASFAANRPPSIWGTPDKTVEAGTTYSFRAKASDPEGKRLVYRISNRPRWATFSSSTGKLMGTPSAAHAGKYSNIVIRVSDGVSTRALPAFTLKVVRANRQPRISGTPAARGEVGKFYTFRPSASDPDGQTLRFDISNKPGWAWFDQKTGKLSGSPGRAGTFRDIVIRVSDGKATARLPAFTLRIAGANSPPRISGAPDASVAVGERYSFRPSASDADDDTLKFSISNKPAWAWFNSSTGKLGGTPGSAGTFDDIVIRVTDGTATAALPAFSIHVEGRGNRAPTLSGAPATGVTVGQAYAFRPGAADADGDTLKFTIANKPAWAAFDTATGALTGRPSAADVGTYDNIVIRVTDGEATVSAPAFSIAVTQSALGSATLTWQPPTQNDDGSILKDLAGYRVHYGTASGDYTQQLEVRNPGVTTLVVDDLPPATWFFVVKAFNSAGVESDGSEEVSKHIR